MNNTPLNKVIDPVCGMAVDKSSCDYMLVREGIEHHFCSAKCKQAFKESHQLPAGEMVRDAVCGMEIRADKAPFSTNYGDRVYFFCSQGCLRVFRQSASKRFKSKTAFGRWLERLANQNDADYGAARSKCH